jgi:hypothetical protein
MVMRKSSLFGHAGRTRGLLVKRRPLRLKTTTAAAIAVLVSSTSALTASAQSIARRVTIQTATGNFLTAANGGGLGGSEPLRTDATTAGAWETFRLQRLSGTAIDGTYALQTANGLFVSAVNGGGIGGPNDATSPVHTDAKTAGGWETWTLNFPSIIAEQGLLAPVTLTTPDGAHFLTANNGGGLGASRADVQNHITPPLVTTSTSVGPAETFHIVMTNSFGEVRGRWGFSFQNSGTLEGVLGGFDMGDMAADFGGGVYLPWNVAQAGVVMGIADVGLTTGNCFGFSILAGRSVMGIRGTYPAWSGLASDVNTTSPLPFPATASDTWHIFGPEVAEVASLARSTPITQDIHRAHLMQVSSQFLGAFVTATNLNGDPQVFRSALEGQHATSPALVTMESSCGHVVLAYGVRDTGGGSYAVDVYDPNVPYLPDEPTNPQEHATRLQDSTLSVTASGSFTYNDNNGESCGGSLSDVRVIALGSVPLPNQAALPGTADMLGAVFNNGAAEISQVADAQGRTLLKSDGSPNKDPATRIPNAVRFQLLGGGRSAPALIYAKAPFVHTYTIRGKSGGRYAARFAAPGMVVEVDDVSTTPGALDSVRVDPSGAIDLRGASAKPFRAKLSVRAGSGPRSVVVYGGVDAGSTAHLEFDAARNAVVYRHAGPRASVHFELSDGPSKATTAALDVENGDTVTVRPAWSALAAGAGTMAHRKAAGTESTRPLR